MTLRLPLLLFVCVHVLAVTTRTAESLTFDAPQRLPDNEFLMVLRTDPGAEVIIESSTNLAQWVVLSSGVASEGTFSYRHVASPDSGLFFRGRLGSGTPPPNVTPTLDANYYARGMVTDSGTTLSLPAGPNLNLSLLLSTNAHLESPIIQMTLVTNIAGLPFAGGFIGAVQVDPKEIELLVPAMMEITFPTNIDRRRVASFTCRADGSEFRLIPDRVTSNRVSFLVPRGGIYGSVIASAQELQELANHTFSINRGDAKPAAEYVSAMAEPDCESQERREAESTQRQLQSMLASASSKWASEIALARQDQDAGVHTDSVALLEKVAGSVCDFYQAHIAPKWASARTSCALAKVLVPLALDAERQAQLLGSTCNILAEIPFCEIHRNCLQEIAQCCAQGLRGPAKVSEVIELVRQDQLLGVDCLSDNEVQDVLAICSSNTWVGTFQILETGSTNQVTEYDEETMTEQMEADMSFNGAVIESFESGFPSQGYNVWFYVSGPIRSSRMVKRENVMEDECKGSRAQVLYSIEETSALVSANEYQYAFYLSIKPDGSYSLFGQPATDRGFDSLPGMETETSFVVFTPCDADGFTENSTNTRNFEFIPREVPNLQGTGSTTKIAGSMEIPKSDNSPATTLRFQWNLQRVGQ